LSTVLFNLFINDLYDYIEQNRIKGIQISPDSVEIFMLLFADDVALISDSWSAITPEFVASVL
jgi:hypothetical protein